MPTITENRKLWNSYEWSQQGEEWSHAWGGSEAQWYGQILPRIHGFIPAERILEIAPGFGRWTRFLRGYCDQLVAVDMAEACVTACQKRFGADPQMSFFLNDGKSLSMIEDGSIDFVFSFDSLVHAEADALEAYVKQFAAKMKPNAVGFIHHSNLGRYQQELSLVRNIPEDSRDVIVKPELQYLTRSHGRAPSMKAELFIDYCKQGGLQCMSQELVNWGSEGLLLDCFSVFTRQDSRWAKPTAVLENPNLMLEAKLIKHIAPLYQVANLHLDK